MTEEKEMPDYSKPEGTSGEELLDTMDKDHTPIALWSYTNMEIKDDDVLLDIGCGSGLNVKRLHEKSPNAKSYGVDYSSTCVKKAIEKNKDLVEKGCVDIIEADVQSLPFDDESIDVVTAFSTIFFWPNLIECFKEVKRVLKPGGKFYMIQGINGIYSSELLDDVRNDNCNFLNDDELKELLLESGYSSSTAFIRKRLENKKLIKRNTTEKYCEKLVDDLFDENIVEEEEPKSPEWLCMLGKK